jgi:dTDP-4-amino-4,6-dideoxygalactose transaminase
MIPNLDLKSQYNKIGSELEAAAISAMRSGEYILGSHVTAFEQNYAAFCGTQEAIGVNSGTSALHLALLALGVDEGDEVITVPMTFVATVAAIRYVKARPVFVDIEPDTWNMCPDALAKAITPRTKVIMPVHLHGRLANMPAIMEIADRFGIPVIEDAAQAHGAELESLRAGSFGSIGCFSFYPGKNLGACGEGGAIVTNDVGLAQTMRKMRDWGQTSRYHHDLPGYNYRMDGIQGAVLNVKLKYLAEWTASRQRVARKYDTLLSGCDIGTPQPASGGEHVYHVYAIRSSQRDRLQEQLKEDGVMTNIHYPRPVHLQKIHVDLGHVAGDFPETEAFARETLSLPMYPELSDEQIQTVVDAVRRHTQPLSTTRLAGSSTPITVD